MSYRFYPHLSSIALLFVAAWATTNPSRAETLSSFNGAVRGNYFQSSRTLDEQRDFLGTTVQMKGTVRHEEDITLKLDARATAPALNRSESADAVLTEGYAVMRHGDWDWLIGKQILAWGRADGINPTDVVSPRHSSVLLPFDEDQREGSWVAQSSYAWSPEVRLSAFWKADFNASAIPLRGQELGAYEFVEPESAFQGGLKLDRTGSEIDWSVSLYRGYSLLPHAGSSQSTQDGALRLTYPMITMLGADVARNFSGWGGRLEAAYVQPRHAARSNEPGLRRNLYVVAGIDRTFYSRLNINGQLFTRRSWDLPSRLNASLEPVQRFNASVFMQEQEQVTGWTLRLAHTWLQETLKTEVFVQRVLDDGDIFVQPMVIYAVSDHAQATAGYQYYGGSGAQFGMLKENRGAFAEIRYAF